MGDDGFPRLSFVLGGSGVRQWIAWEAGYWVTRTGEVTPLKATPHPSPMPHVCSTPAFVSCTMAAEHRGLLQPTAPAPSSTWAALLSLGLGCTFTYLLFTQPQGQSALYAAPATRTLTQPLVGTSAQPRPTIPAPYASAVPREALARPQGVASVGPEGVQGVLHRITALPPQAAVPVLAAFLMGLGVVMRVYASLKQREAKKEEFCRFVQDLPDVLSIRCEGLCSPPTPPHHLFP